MKVFQVEEQWSREHLRPSTRPDPHPGPGEVRVAMRAAALNYRDLLVPQRGYGARMQALPLIMLSDGAGIVDAVGPGVTTVAVGERVCPLFFQSWTGGPATGRRLGRSLGCEVDGTMAEYRVLPEAGVAPVPAHLDDFQAATLPTAAVTAWRALIGEGRVRPGDKVLVQGTGGVSLFALQFARLAGCQVVVTSSSDEKLARARLLGADATINYRSVPDWGRRAREIAGGGGVDHIVEVGGENTLGHSLRAIRPGGTISLIGVLSGGRMDASLGLVVTRHVRLQGITVGSRDDFLAMSAAIGQHALQPVVDRVFPFAALHEALDYLASGRHFGKVCVSIRDDL
ncbi:NAD(P)-dependent alcohol dehydrogenase [Accumulibacter sp.]|uniref:zinc-dependent alcohol dehydrogenase family protein n=1 Tax=Accumulibacter sp. TaxID=2053492 RepID=UPI0025E3166A|nr:NAD(P)-dependent alcohol dehydrogenase [Accumulibacter sp.]MCM8594738.1 NAD(P)-dependent alcohol dehydrogenase [Accumulibacter sp.]MCM8625845.1 NAD(P)-dependent alcohol dehydrogenase [Accumulibacter sp.]MDS4048884.1 NAD(P)-dependent alcohol dehydrogenase [Accumulibacter sp.]